MKDLSYKSKTNRNRNTLENTRDFWYKKYGKEISLEEARQINERVIEYFRLLYKWDQRYKQKTENGGEAK